MLQVDQSDFAFDIKVIIRQQGDVLAVLRGDDAMAFLEELPRTGSETDRKAYTARYLSQHFVAVWLAISKANPLQQVQAYPLDENSFQQCADLKELKEQLSHAHYNAARAFYLGSLCFIQQTPEQDAWLVIRDYLPFEIICCKSMIENGDFDSWLRRVTAATDAQLKTLNY